MSELADNQRPDEAAGRDRDRVGAASTGPLSEVQRLNPGLIGLPAIAIAIFLCGYLTLLLPRSPEHFTPVGLVDSVLLAALLLAHQRSWPRVLAAAAVGELAVGFVLGAAPGLVIAVTLCSLVICTLSAAWILHVLGDEPDMARLPNIARYLGIVAVMAGGGAVVASLVRAAVADDPVWPNLLIWASRDFTGMATLTPCLLVVASRLNEIRQMVGPRGWPVAVLVVVEAATFLTEQTPSTYLLMATLLFVAWRFRMAGAALGVLLTYAFSIPLTLAGHGPFAAMGGSPTEQLLGLQFFLTVTFHTAVPVAAQLARSRALQAALAGALAASHEAEARSRTVTESMRDIVVQLDMAGRLTFVSPASRLLGYVPEELVGMIGADFVHPDDLPRLRDNTARVLRAEPVPNPNNRLRLRLKDGAYRWFEGSPSRMVDAQGQPTGLVNVFRDIHDQRLADEALAASEARYRLLADNMNDLVVCYGTDGLITFASGATRQILGRRPHDLVGRRLGGWVHPDDRESSLAAFQRNRAVGPSAPPFRVEYRMRRPDGSWVWLQANPRAIFDADGVFVEWQDVVRDVTQSKLLEEELRAARSRADAAAKSKADFLADMGHEVRGPLNSIIGFARMARTQKDRVEWCMDCIDEASRSLLTMVGDILDLSRLEAAQVNFRAEPLRLSEFLRTTLAQLEPQARAKGLRLGLVDRTDGEQVIVTDANRLRQVLLNLLGNAVKFTHEGEVELRVGYDAEQGRLAVAVQDTGPGVPSDQLADLFVRFSPAHPSGGSAPGGVGLGLAISKGIVEGLGGEVSAESEPGQGSCFRFWIPAPPAGEGAEAARDAPPPPMLRIMVATAEPSLQGLVAQSLARRADVLPADDLAAAARLAAQEPLDLIIVDLALGRGASTLRRLRTASGPNSRTPALAFSNDMGDEVHARAAGQGFQGLLAKASTAPELVSGVAEALLSADLWDRAPVRPSGRRWPRGAEGGPPGA